MNIKLIASLEIEKDGKLFVLQMPYGAAYQAAYDATVEFGQYIVEMSKKSEEEKKQNESKTE